MIGLVILLSSLALGGASAWHVREQGAAARAKERQRRQALEEQSQAADFADREARRRQAEAAAAAARKQRETEDARQRAEAAHAERQRRTYLSQPGRLMAHFAQLLRQDHLRIDTRLGHLAQDEVADRAALAELPADEAASRHWLRRLGWVLLVITSVISATQLVPSFRVLSGQPGAVDVLLGVGLALLEVGVAFMLWHELRPTGGLGTFAAKVKAALAVVFATLVIIGQVLWAPAHDTVPLTREIAAAHETLTADQASRQPGKAAVISADKNEITTLEHQLTIAKDRDQALALFVTFGADIAAGMAIAGLDSAAHRRRRHELVGRIDARETERRGLVEQRNAAEVQRTTEMTEMAIQLGLNPEALAGDPANGIPAQGQGQPQPAPAPATVPPTAPQPGAGGVVRPRDIFAPPPTGPVAGPTNPPTDPAAGPTGPTHTDRRWSDPL